MKTTVLVACLSAALMTSTASANEPWKTIPDSPASAAAMTSDSATMTTADSESEAIAVLTAVNDHDVKAAEMALEKNPSADVAAYAQMLRDEHTSNQEKTRAVADAGEIATQESPAVEALIAKSNAKREELSGLHAEAFERAYIDAMVQGHTEALAKIDNELLPNATDAELVRHLSETRTHIAGHLEQARKLESNLQASR